MGYDLGCEQHPEHRMLVTMIQLKRLVLYIATFDHAEHLRPQPADDCWNTIWPSPRLVTQFPPRRLLSASDLEWALKDFRGWLNVPRGPVIPAG
ncbi:MAG TPA: hypothetical protein VFM54_18005 [Micromonosporaceae bacterium]|nr:hypothetical protein [Micromonosporaceae bacterium]